MGDLLLAGQEGTHLASAEGLDERRREGRRLAPSPAESRTLAEADGGLCRLEREDQGRPGCRSDAGGCP